MKRIALLALGAALALTAAGCQNGVFNIAPQAPIAPPGGIILLKQRAPLALSSEAPDAVPAQGVPFSPTMKCGTAEATNLVIYYQALSVAWGDCSIETAARNAGITKIAFADYEIFSVFGLYNQIIVRVFGE